ncbi:MAG TPA: DUF72 domain-containing protein [Pyrinomonadaceae bacterium]|nr:DUF72 domain-containing protein [Pyrinomonadaceae bacterium]
MPKRTKQLTQPAIKVGTCGFRYTKHQYAELLKCVEIQHTFYQPPQVKTLERWRSEMPDGFEFTLKAWQLITHESTSPTYKRLKKKLTEKEAEESGFFKPTDIVAEALATTLACADALHARTILFQGPAKFTQTKEHIADLRKFFKKIDRGERNFAWEPRGPWEDGVVKKICDDLDLWHVVDPFVRRTVTPDRCYLRLHGIGGWRYKYEDGELEELASMLPTENLAYVFFNNNEMTADAMRFEKVLKG